MADIQWRKILLLLPWGCSIVALIILIGAVTDQKGTEVCSGVFIDIDYSDNNFFVEKENIEALLYSGDNPVVIGGKLNELNLNDIEQNFYSNPFIKSAQVYTDINGRIFVHITQKKPIFKVINTTGVNYYIDDNGGKLPIYSKFTTRVPVANGYIREGISLFDRRNSLLLKDIYMLVNYINKDAFWKAQIEQIYVNEAGELELIPKLGNHIILLGDVNNLENKLKNLMVFYKEGLKNAGWYTYKLINLKYSDQIVCIKY